MFHNKPWALLAFLIIMPFVVIGTQKLGWGTSGLLISVGVAALAAALIFFTVKKIRTMYRRSFRNRGDLIAFAFGVEQQHDTALVPYGSNQQESEDYIEGETVYINEGTTGPAALPIPPEQLPENRFRLYLGSHTLDVEDAYTTALILETMREGSRGALRVIAEELARLQLPFLLVDTTGDGFLTLLPELQEFGHVVGSMSAHRKLPTRQQAHSVPLDLDKETATEEDYHKLYRQAESFGITMLQHGWQTIFRFASYEQNPGLAVRILLHVIRGMRKWERRHIQDGEAPLPAFVILTDAYRFLPSDDEHSIVNMEPEMAHLVTQHLLSSLAEQGTYGIYVYLATRKIVGMRREALDACKLWYLKEPAASEYARIERYTGMTVQDLQTAEHQQVLLVEPGEDEYHQITFRPTRTVHEREEETAPHTFLPAPAEVVKATCPAITTAYVERREETTEAAGWEEMEALAPNPRVSEKKTPETAAETPVAEVNLGSPGFSKAEIAWACSLLKAGWQQPHAVQEAPAHMRDQALALGLKAQRGANTIGNKRATALFRYVRYKMSPTARIPSLQYAAECLRQWQAHQGTASPRQPVTVGASSENSDQEGHQTEGKTTEESSAEPTSLHWRLPLLDEVLTSKAVQQQAGDEFEEVFKEAMAERVATTLASFRVEAEVRPEDISIGPTVVRLGIRPTGKPLLKEDEKGHPVPVRDAAGNNVYEVRTRVSRIMALQNDLALVLEARTIRMEAPVPGRPYVGVEIPNVNARLVTLREILESKEYKAAKEESKLTVALGRDVAGAIRIGDLAKMPHLLIAGATGSGKSVAINTIISSLITQATPQDVRILMVDPKMVELTLYNGIPHLLAPVVTEAAKVVSLLKIAIAEMEQRYRLFSQLGVRNLNGYRRLRAEKIAHGDTTLNNLPAIVIIIDELADLMMVASEEVEGLICRLAQLARATGIHLVVATQRPSVDVITGLIKANIPTRLAFMVSSSVDSRTIIDMGGAERLLGRGDMLYLPADAGKPERIQGAFVADDDAECLAKYWRKQFEDLKATGRFAPPTVTTEASDGAIEQQHFEWNIPETPETEIEPAPSFPTTGQHVNSQVMRHIQRYLQGSRYLNGRLVSMEEGRVPEGVMLPCAFTLLTPSNQLLAAEAAVWFTQRNSATGIRTQLGIGAERAGKLRDELAAKGFADRDAPPSASQASPALKPLLVTCGFLEEEACDTALEVHEEEAEIQQHTPA